MTKIRILALGDVVGQPGRDIIKSHLPGLREKYQFDFLLINAENSAGGHGITPAIADELFELGADALTLGDHTFDQKEITVYLENKSRAILRPANFPPACAGRGALVLEKSGKKIGLMNLIGRVFIENLSDCPFRMADKLLAEDLADCRVVVLDMHAEATSEKIAIARYLDGRISLIYGTHTHVPTADEQILPGGTGYLTDLGMCGSYANVIGMQSDLAISRFLGVRKAYKIGKGDEKIGGLFAEVDMLTGKTLLLERIHY